MLIFPARTFNPIRQKGFSLLEILVAITLIGVVALMSINFVQNDRGKLEETLSEFDRAVRYAANESIFRNSIVRIKLILNEEPHQYIVEYGKGADFVLPEAIDLSEISNSQRENAVKKIKKFDSQFSVTPYFEDGPKQLDDNVFIYGVGSTYHDKVLSEGEISIYFYPSGERDTSIIFLYTSEEMAALKIPPFEDRTYDEYYIFNETELDYLEDTLLSKSKEVFSQWLKE